MLGLYCIGREKKEFSCTYRLYRMVMLNSSHWGVFLLILGVIMHFQKKYK
jgi:hypothetical protein